LSFLQRSVAGNLISPQLPISPHRHSGLRRNDDEVLRGFFDGKIHPMNAAKVMCNLGFQFPRTAMRFRADDGKEAGKRWDFNPAYSRLS